MKASLALFILSWIGHTVWCALCPGPDGPECKFEDIKFNGTKSLCKEVLIKKTTKIDINQDWTSKFPEMVCLRFLRIKNFSSSNKTGTWPKTLEHLIFHNCEMEEMPKLNGDNNITNLRIEGTDLSLTKIQHLESYPNLEKFYVGLKSTYNLLSETFSSNAKLTTITLHYVNITQLPEKMLDNLSQLKTFEIITHYNYSESGSKFTVPEEGFFSKSSKLENITLKAPCMEDWPRDLFKNLTALRTMKFGTEDCNFTLNPQAFAEDYANVTSIELTNINLEKGDQFLKRFPNLAELSLENSGLRYYDGSNMPTSNDVQLTLNPVPCELDLSSLNYLLKLGDNLEAENITCNGYEYQPKQYLKTRKIQKVLEILFATCVPTAIIVIALVVFWKTVKIACHLCSAWIYLKLKGPNNDCQDRLFIVYHDADATKEVTKNIESRIKEHGVTVITKDSVEHGYVWGKSEDSEFNRLSGWNPETKVRDPNPPCKFIVFLLSERFLRSRFCREQVMKVIKDDKTFMVNIDNNVNLVKELKTEHSGEVGWSDITPIYKKWEKQPPIQKSDLILLFRKLKLPLANLPMHMSNLREEDPLMNGGQNQA